MGYACRGLIRSGRVTAVAAGAVAAMAIFLLVFANSIRIHQASLDDAYDHLEVVAHVEGALAGSAPVLKDESCQALLDSGFVVEYGAMIRFDQTGHADLKGVDRPDMDPVLQNALPYVAWLEGWGADIFAGDALCCLVPESVPAEPGETHVFRLGPEHELELLVVGVYPTEYGGGCFCPVETLRQACRERGLPVQYSGLRMRLGRLRELDRFKALLNELGLDQGRARAVVDDTLLREVAGRLNRQIRLLKQVMPIFLALVSATGFGLSFLLLSRRKREAAVLRTLGMSRGRVFWTLLAETAMQALCGGILGSVIVALVLGAKAVQPLYLAALLLCYLLGGAAAVWQLSGVNVFSSMAGRA